MVFVVRSDPQKVKLSWPVLIGSKTLRVSFELQQIASLLASASVAILKALGPKDGPVLGIDLDDRHHPILPTSIASVPTWSRSTTKDLNVERPVRVEKQARKVGFALANIQLVRHSPPFTHPAHAQC